MPNLIDPEIITFFSPIEVYSSALLHIFVKTLDGKTISTYVQPDALVFDIMEQIADKTNVPIFDQRLQFAGKQLTATEPITTYNLHTENTLHLVGGRLGGGMGEHRTVSAFLLAKIVHGNVTRLITKESVLAVNFMVLRQIL